MTVFGTRPEAIKMAPLVKELNKRSERFESIVTVTAQHREMLDQVLDIFRIKPDYDLDIMKQNQTLAQITNRTLNGLDEIMKETKPDVVLVHGDTSTTFAASLAAFYNQIIVGHVEAGLRTWNKYSPYPEEMNRQLTGVIADLHFAPTDKAKQNLLNENKAEETIYVTGNTAIDALNTTITDTYSSRVLDELGDKRLVLMTAHRRENLGQNMNQIFRAIKRLTQEHEDIQVIYPVHLNPVVQQAANNILGDNEKVTLIDPLGAVDFHNFAAQAHIILTDSGGVQEEAPSLGVPVLVLRDTTERPEGVDAGTLKLAGTNEEDIFHLANELLSDDEAYEKMAKASNPYGDGHASQRIVDGILAYFEKG
ncbi:UDP-N-acetylglucosamine 2-epimerase (non-hydrolyzing) [Virgibacillus sp. NKC19-3]|uniref:non-hydrolyzing UDP-N-acetylglucosamine 2-epimerase n=1 Tax=Virgibacillus saliphilus TaxID=2831674 RepID=UPI001C9B83C5|nr:UDP-N-acetylglucosamine 2-epimerase (non-hydrolyzing) [Virgibacillus sp. NKC19-3]MBY7144654.1 UDP-N-acetylglucosamine 2-epimerase (non-hydrolyzing) [Virgibacillus sp. NKC19-3]